AWDPGPVLDRVFGYQSGIEGGATRHYDDLVDATQLGLGNADLVQSELGFGVMAAQQRVSYRAGLLVDLLPHEPVVAALLCRGQVPVHVIGLYDGGFAVEGDHLNPVGCDGDQLVLTELNGLASVLDERGDIGRDEVLALPNADDQRGVASRRNHSVRCLAVHRDQRERAM